VSKIKTEAIISIIGRETIGGEDLEVTSIIVVTKRDKFERGKKASSRVIEETEIIIIMEMEIDKITTTEMATDNIIMAMEMETQIDNTTTIIEMGIDRIIINKIHQPPA
jgi:hypothetical protein